jgi:hypothetical protein
MLHPIIVRILRKDHTEQMPEFDDTIMIKKLTENRLRVTYTEKSGDEPIVDISYMGYQQFMIYMHRVLFLLVIDNDPFLSVQFMMPGYPSTLVTIPNLKERMTPLLEILWSTCVNWPTTGNVPDE